MMALPSGVEGMMVGDIGLETDWAEALNGIEGIIHLAARVHVMRESTVDPLAAFRQVNVAGTQRLARQAAEVGVKRLVYISSAKVNGERTEDGGQKSEVRGRGKTEIRGQGSGIKTNSGIEGFRNLEIEGQKGRKSEVGGRGSVSKEFFSEKDVPAPQDPYAVSKWEAEQVLNSIAGKRGLEVVTLRPPLVYGPGVGANFLRLVKLVKLGVPLPFGCVKNRRSLIYIGNLVDAIVTCMTHPNAAGKTYLVSDGEDVSTPDLIRRISAASNRRALMLPVPVWMMRMAGRIIGRSDELDRLLGSLTVDISKIRSELNWYPPFTMEEGIRETVSWYKSADPPAIAYNNSVSDR
jgi:nucleoside-diphosphate-sugar epimerase